VNRGARQFLIALFVAAAGAAAVFAQVRAETIVLSDTIPIRTTNWSDEFVLPAFSPTVGELNAITLTFITPIVGSVSYENTSNERVLITSTHAVSLTIRLLNGRELYVLPQAVRVDEVPPFDGLADYQGASGASFAMETAVVSTQVYTTPADLARFYGDGALQFPITAVGASTILGPGNFNAILRSQAAGAGLVTYFDYRPFDFAVEKLTNQQHADDANGRDVPVIFPGAPVTWTYLVTNTGATTIPLTEIVVTDSDPRVTPLFDPTSDNGDQLLSPGEVWRYYAVGAALDLTVDHPAVTVVPGCGNAAVPSLQRAYENIVTVEIYDLSKADPSHYCTPTRRRLEPGLTFKKLLNGADADAPNDPDVPFVFPGAVMTWTYLLTNTGDISFTLAQIDLQDDDPALTIHFDSSSDDGNGLLAPGERWRYTAVGTAHNLMLDTSTITVVNGCDPNNLGTQSIAYRNIGTVAIGNLILSDPAHYCNFPPTVLNDGSDGRTRKNAVYLPLVAR
jgi:archaellum component FlaG (FlaF/FlaG flagellin family)